MGFIQAAKATLNGRSLTLSQTDVPFPCAYPTMRDNELEGVNIYKRAYVLKNISCKESCLQSCPTAEFLYHVLPSEAIAF